jgi:hypothetical protein
MAQASTFNFRWLVCVGLVIIVSGCAGSSETAPSISTAPAVLSERAVTKDQIQPDTRPPQLEATVTYDCCEPSDTTAPRGLTIASSQQDPQVSVSVEFYSNGTTLTLFRDSADVVWSISQLGQETLRCADDWEPVQIGPVEGCRTVQPALTFVHWQASGYLWQAEVDNRSDQRFRDFLGSSSVVPVG